MSKKIYLAPSSQPNNIYAAGNTNEQEQCDRISDFVKTALERCGFQVKKSVKGASTNTKVSESNSWGAHLHIPIHTNAFNNATTGGTLVMLYSMATENQKAGKTILDAVAPISPGPDYSLRVRSDLAELNSTKAIAVYLEVEFHDTKAGAEWIIANVKPIGEAICKGVCNYYGVTYKPENGVNPEPSGKLFRVQIGAFSVRSNAEKFLQEAKIKGYSDAFIVES